MLRVLNREGELPIAELAQMARMDLGAVSRQLRAMEAAGLVHAQGGAVGPAGGARAPDPVGQGARPAHPPHRARPARARASPTGTPPTSTAWPILLGRMVDDLAGTGFRRP